MVCGIMCSFKLFLSVSLPVTQDLMTSNSIYEYCMEISNYSLPL